MARTDEEILTTNAHISDAEIERDIADTEREIRELEAEVKHLEATPPSLASKMNHFRASARRDGIQRRKEFVQQLRHLLMLRSQQVSQP